MNNNSPTILQENLSDELVDELVDGGNGLINYDKCLAIVNLKSSNKLPRQCHNKHLKNGNLCGVHAKAKKVVMADVFWKNLMPLMQNDENEDSIDIGKLKLITGNDPIPNNVLTSQNLKNDMVDIDPIKF